MAPGSHIREVWRYDSYSSRPDKLQTKVHGRQAKQDKKTDKSVKLSPIKKKVSIYNNPKIKDRSGWLYNWTDLSDKENSYLNNTLFC